MHPSHFEALKNSYFLCNGLGGLRINTSTTALQKADIYYYILQNHFPALSLSRLDANPFGLKFK